MTAVALDTNALMMPVELGVRVFDELERLLGAADLLVPMAVHEELRRLADGSGEAATAARVGADLVRERCRLVETETGDADDAIVELAREGRIDYAVTNDQPLRDRLLSAEVPVIGVRGHDTLAIREP